MQKAAIAVALLVAGVIWGVSVTYLSMRGHKDTVTVVKVVPHKKLSLKSSVDMADKLVGQDFMKLKGDAPVVMWQEKKSGETLGEADVFSTYGVKTNEQKRQARAILRKNGYRRVYEHCQSLSRPDFRWRFGYCTYRNAPVGQEA